MTRRATNDKSLSKLRGNLVLVGAGKMGSAMLEGWLARGLKPSRLVVLEPQPMKSVKALVKRGLRLNPKPDGAEVAAIVVAVKPQTAPEALPPLAARIGKSTLVLSIMAGRTLGFLASSLGRDAALVRAMPNTPAAIGRAITVAVTNGKASARQRKLAGELLAAIGAVEWVENEALMDAVTAVSGSGPAYVYLLAEALAHAGVKAGLPAELAARLACETVAGAGELLHRSPLDAAMLRQNVTSPGGTTAAALDILMGADGLSELMIKAIAAATKRSRDLAG